MKNLSVNSKKIISYVERGIAMVLCVTTLGAFASCSSKSSENEKPKTGVEDQLDKEQKDLTLAEKRSEEIRNAEDSNIKFIETYEIVSETENLRGEKLYIVSLKENDGAVGLFNFNTLTEEIPCGKYDMIGMEFKDISNGQTYRFVSVPDDDLYRYGWLNMETFEEDIPCGKYDYISDREFEDNGKAYYFVNVPECEEYIPGWLNMETFEEDIPCGKYDYISSGKFEYNGKTYRFVSVPDDDLYRYGWLNMETFEEDIPCGKYDYISESDFQYNGKTYRYVNVPECEEYMPGWLNMETFEEDIPCKTYVDSEVVTIDDVDYYTFKDKEGKEKVYSFKK